VPKAAVEQGSAGRLNNSKMQPHPLDNTTNLYYTSVHNRFMECGP